MKKLIILTIGLFTLNATAQELGVHIGTNINSYSLSSETKFKDGFENSVKSRTGLDIAFSYRLKVNHALSFEPLVGMQSTKSGFNQVKKVNNQIEVEREFDVSESYFFLQPMVSYHFHNKWAFLGGLNLRLSNSGNSFTYTRKTNEVTKEIETETTPTKLNLMEYNYIDFVAGVQYETKGFIGFYFKYQKQIIEFQKSFSKEFSPVGTLTFGASFRIDQDKLSKYN